LSFLSVPRRDQQRGDHTRDPAAAGENEYQEQRAAAFVDDGQGREDDAEDDSPE